ncbi:hypothetical protein AB0D71_21625 [Streptomyces avermitilis]|uniref:hypothetical protein n=1 Tax=Streptomyces avermitilis TaxID=33903 RepID=UPI0033F310EA
MAVEQLPGQVGEFARYLNGLLARLDQDGGWCGVFWQRDPDGMRACLDGWEVPPWDVVEALLQDLAAEYGPGAVAEEAERARSLHAASLAAYDARPGGRDALGDRLDVMLREQRYAAERQAELGRLLPSAGSHEEADSVRLDLAWARDDHDRATARCAELRRRMEDLDRRARRTHGQGTQNFPPSGSGSGTGGVFRAEDAGQREPDGTGDGRPRQLRPQQQGYGPTGRADLSGRTDLSGPTGPTDFDGLTGPSAPTDPVSPTGRTDHTGPISPTDLTDPAHATDNPPPVTPEAPPTVPKQRGKRRPRGSARFAGMTDAEETPPAALPAAPAPAPAPSARRTPRGARFAGAAGQAPAPKPRREPLDDEARRDTVEAVRTLTRLRGEGRSGEAHALLVEAAYWPAARFPLLAAELHRVGLGADWATLLWEAASLPADRLVAAADALVAAGRTVDGQQMLRQGVVRPAPEIGEAVLGLTGDGRHREARALLDAYIRMRSPEEAARSVEADPHKLVPLLLEAARGASEERHRDLVHALRVAGFTT